ncbi:MAG: Lar family restriction alleviation protein, partial [Synergistaceae bacterium]|nr:Lar family restriction alleviation protein [Synergistaceae bacterium]
CPFCGGTARLYSGKINFYPYDHRYRVWCEKCNAMSNLFRTREEAVASWNRRVS